MKSGLLLKNGFGHGVKTNPSDLDSAEAAN